LWKTADDNAQFLHPSSASIRVRLNGGALDRIPNRKAVAGQGRPVLANSISACVAWIRREEVRCSDDRGTRSKAIIIFMAVHLVPSQHFTASGIHITLRTLNTTSYFSDGRFDLATEIPRPLVLSARRTNFSLHLA
jgi:hypothetical protein